MPCHQILLPSSAFRNKVFFFSSLYGVQERAENFLWFHVKSPTFPPGKYYTWSTVAAASTSSPENALYRNVSVPQWKTKEWLFSCHSQTQLSL